ncbi:uncharacterized protein LOC135395887 [Ornithodoros turicata]|uniref:uncharacterized protein LOC135395887 n=1 Tax=Ornithodoros turicata TaxID=34597 RepID=UPI003138DEAC
MALLRSCCCWKSVRNGSFASAIYTLVFYTILVAAGMCHMSSVLQSSVRFTLGLFLLTFSGLSAISSIVLLVGLFLDNRILLIPWLTIVSMTTLLDIVLSLYLITDLPVNPFVITMYIIDYILCAVNVYCILCVLSQYQEYIVGSRSTIFSDTHPGGLTHYVNGLERPKPHLKVTSPSQSSSGQDLTVQLTRAQPELLFVDTLERPYLGDDLSSVLQASMDETSLQVSVEGRLSGREFGQTENVDHRATPGENGAGEPLCRVKESHTEAELHVDGTS